MEVIEDLILFGTIHDAEKNLVHVIIDLFTAGSDTLNSTLNFGFLYLVTRGDVMTKVQQEIDHVVGRIRLPNSEDRKMWGVFTLYSIFFDLGFRLYVFVNFL